MSGCSFEDFCLPSSENQTKADVGFVCRDVGYPTRLQSYLPADCRLKKSQYLAFYSGRHTGVIMLILKNRSSKLEFSLSLTYLHDQISLEMRMKVSFSSHSSQLFIQCSVFPSFLRTAAFVLAAKHFILFFQSSQTSRRTLEINIWEIPDDR